MEQGILDFGTVDPRIRAFRVFHAENPHVFRLFERFALEAAARRKRFSSDAVLHRLRWFTQIETDDPAGFKINDHWSAFYARLFLEQHPELAGFFELRRSVADRVASVA